MRYLPLILLLLPLNAAALICERYGTCADTKLNQTYEIKKEIRIQAERVRRQHVKPVRRPVIRPEHKARKELLHK